MQAARAPSAETNELQASTQPKDSTSIEQIGRIARIEKLAPILFVAVFAFLLGSFPARNADFWYHIATGRDLIHGAQIVEPSDAAFALYPSYLYDVGTYLLYSLIGGTGLVILKSLVVVGIALTILRLSYQGGSMFWPVVCTTIAVLAMSLRFLLQPVLISYLFFALTLLLLRPTVTNTREKTAITPPWPLLILFWAWANIDQWFVLGLLTIGLYWIGEVIDLRRAKQLDGKLLGRKVLAFVSLSAVCLVNPITIYAFALPMELDFLGWRSGQRQAIASPFAANYLLTIGNSPAGLAYYPLLILGMLSFLMRFPRINWRWLLPWVALAVLSALQARLIPFFAILAGPMLAWNVHAIVERRKEMGKKTKRWVAELGLAVRKAAIIFSPLLLICAWPGWLQAPPYGPRQWNVPTPMSIVRAAKRVDHWREEGRLRDDRRGLILTPDAFYAFRWFCPEEKGILNSRLTQSLLSRDTPADEIDQAMREHHIDRLYVYDTDRGQLQLILNRLFAQPQRWPLLGVDGDMAIFGWRDPIEAAKPDPYAGWELDYEHVSFNPTDAEKAPQVVESLALAPQQFWEAFWTPATVRAIDRAEAEFYLLYAEAIRATANRRHYVAWSAAQTIGLLGAAAGWTPETVVHGLPLRLAMLQPATPTNPSSTTPPPESRIALAWQQAFVPHLDDTPPALLYLAIRAARRALAEQSTDARAYLVLGECYLRLLHNTRERVWGRQLQELSQLRTVQACEALNRAVELEPDLLQAHLNLAWLYKEIGYLDLSLKHFQKTFELVRQAGPPRGVTKLDFQMQLAAQEKEVNSFAEEVQRRLRDYELQARNIRVYDRAMLAMERGLAGKAAEVLLASDIAAFGAQGMALELRLLLNMGQANLVWQWTSIEHKISIGEKTYHWLRAMAASAIGDYGYADDELLAMLGGDPTLDIERIKFAIGSWAGQTVLEYVPRYQPIPQLVKHAVYRLDFNDQMAILLQQMRQAADINTIRAVLAVERGDVALAKTSFETALSIWQKDGEVTDTSVEFGGRPICEAYLHWLKSK